jgi:hypothetical protein
MDGAKAGSGFKLSFIRTSLKGLIMNIRQIAAAGALMLGAVAANASIATDTTFWQFSVGTTPTNVSILAGSSTGGIVSFSSITNLDPGETVTPFFPSGNTAKLTFRGLNVGTYQVKLVTVAGAPYSVGAFAGTTPLAVTQVPEPESYALALAGLGVAGLLIRRRQAA